MAAKGAGTGDLPNELKGDASLIEALLEGAPMGIFLVDREFAIQYANPVLAQWIRKRANEVVGKKCYEILFGNRQPCKAGEKTCPAAEALGSAKVAGPVTFLRQDPEGQQQYLRVHSHPVLDGKGSPAYAAEFIQDVTSERLLKDYREEAALRDPLTGFFNRQGFNHLLERELKRTKRQGHPLSLCLIDLDSFKDYNDRKGEKAGDALLERLAGTLVAQTRVGVDALCRLQADTFALILPEASHAQALRIGSRVRRVAKEARLPVSFSMAVCESEDLEDADAFYHRTADTLFQAKKSGGNRTL
jgi:diguanylate cyclase (GGDEF)-like protein/PAS domain S-box-containing protein